METIQLVHSYKVTINGSSLGGHKIILFLVSSTASFYLLFFDFKKFWWSKGHYCSDSLHHTITLIASCWGCYGTLSFWWLLSPNRMMRMMKVRTMTRRKVTMTATMMTVDSSAAVSVLMLYQTSGWEGAQTLVNINNVSSMFVVGWWWWNIFWADPGLRSDWSECGTMIGEETRDAGSTPTMLQTPDTAVVTGTRPLPTIWTNLISFGNNTALN